MKNSPSIFTTVTFLADLNSMKCRDIRKRVDIVGDTSKPLTVRLEPNYADHPLVVGPRYIEKDFRMLFVNYLGVRTSGVVGELKRYIFTYNRLA